jgi:hypothetical protein
VDLSILDNVNGRQFHFVAKTSIEMNVHLAALLLTVSNGCATTTTLANGETSPSRASLTLQMPERVGRNDAVRVVLKNEGRGPLWVNVVIGLNRPREGEIWLEITSDSETIPFGGYVHLRDPVLRDYALLCPHEIATGRATLEWFPSLKVGTRYTARAHYKDRNKKPPSPPRGSRYLGEELISPPVQFEVVD